MKRILAATIALIASIIFMGALQEFKWSQFIPPQIEGSGMKSIYISDSTDLTEISREWFEYYTSDLTGWTVPYEYRIQKAQIDQVEMLDGSYVQIDATIWPASANEDLANNLELAGTMERYHYAYQSVLLWRKEGNKWVIDEKMRPVQYQIQTPEFQEEIRKPQTEHYALQTDKEMTYYIRDGVLYVTYDAGRTFQEVEDGYEKVCQEVNGAYQELIPDNSYVITPEFTAFVGYSNEKTSLIYSTDKGETWLESEIYDGGFKANTFLAKTENRCYATFAVDRSLGSDYYATFWSDDMQTWNSVDLPETLWSNLTGSFWSDDMTGYYAKYSNTFTVTKDGGVSFQEMQYPEPQEVIDEIGFNPYDTMEEMYVENGVVYMVVGQGDDADYVKDGELMKALYESQDGVNFTFVKEIADTTQLAG